MKFNTKKIQNIFNIQDKVAIVTGASRGIGEAIAHGFASFGANVVLAARTEEKLFLNSIQINDTGGSALPVKTDVTNYNDLLELVNKTISKYKKIDILVNCAGTTNGNPSHEYTQSDWELTISTNLKSAFDLSQLVGKEMINTGKGGSIINITSVAAVLASPQNPAYNAAKGGLRQLTKALAADWGIYNIRVNNLGPGYFHTELNEKSWKDPKLRKIRSDRSLLKRWAEPFEIIGPAIFLASDASSFITGQDIYVDGGFLAKSL